jgi:hypothetical protein
MLYGTLYVGPCDGAWRRDIYVDRDGRRHEEGAMHAGEGDVSPRHDKLDHYDSRCSCCWLNICHTEDRHVRDTTSAR